MRALLRLLAAVVLASGPAAVFLPGVASAQSGTPVNIVNFEYQPGQFELPLGATVTWKNTSDRPHTVTDRGGTFDTDPILPGATASVTFTTPGTYHVFCRINPSKMNGIIVVDGSGAATPTVRLEAVDPALDGETLRFEPPVFTVKAGTNVVFANVGGLPHTFTADDGTFDSGVLAPGPDGGRFAGSSVFVALSKPGTYNFHCEIHPNAMKGTVTVEGDAPAPPGPAPPSAAPAKATVDMVDFAFKEKQVSVAPGGQVTFTNSGDAPHTATLDDVKADTGTIQPRKSAVLTAPDKPGSYSYRCTIHPDRMRAVLVVLGQNTADPSAAATGPPYGQVAGARGAGGGVSKLVLVTGVIGAFLGGFGIAGFARPTYGVGEQDE